MIPGSDFETSIEKLRMDPDKDIREVICNHAPYYLPPPPLPTSAPPQECTQDAPQPVFMMYEGEQLSYQDAYNDVEFKKDEGNEGFNLQDSHLSLITKPISLTPSSFPQHSYASVVTTKPVLCTEQPEYQSADSTTLEYNHLAENHTSTLAITELSQESNNQNTTTQPSNETTTQLSNETTTHPSNETTSLPSNETTTQPSNGTQTSTQTTEDTHTSTNTHKDTQNTEGTSASSAGTFLCSMVTASTTDNPVTSTTTY